MRAVPPSRFLLRSRLRRAPAARDAPSSARPAGSRSSPAGSRRPSASRRCPRRSAGRRRSARRAHRRRAARWFGSFTHPDSRPRQYPAPVPLVRRRLRFWLPSGEIIAYAVALGPRTQSAIAASVLRGPPPCDQARGNGASLDVTMRHAEVAGESVVQELSDLPHVGAARQPHEERSDHAVRGTELRLSSTNHNSQKRAAKWSTVIPDLDDPAHWDWPLVTRVCSSTAVATGDGARRHLSPAQVTPLSPAASEVGVSAEYVLVVAVVFVGASAARQRSHWAGWRVDTAATHVR